MLPSSQRTTLLLRQLTVCWRLSLLQLLSLLLMFLLHLLCLLLVFLLLVVRLSKPSGTAKDSDAVFSPAATAHGKLRYKQGYTPAMLVHESRILQVTLFGTLQSNLSFLDFSLLLPDVMTIADEVDAQLTQSMDSYMDAMRTPVAA